MTNTKIYTIIHTFGETACFLYLIDIYNLICIRGRNTY